MLDKLRVAAHWCERNVAELTIVALLAIGTVVVLLPLMVYTVPAGHAGVLWKRFSGGTVLDRTYGEGINFVLPWDKFTIYDLRARMGEQKMDVLVLDGLPVNVDIAFRYRVGAGQLAYLHQHVGPQYMNVLLGPDIASETRHALAQVRAEDLYSGRRSEYEDRILAATRKNIEAVFTPLGLDKSRFLIVEDVLIRGVVLPPVVQAAIDRKNEQLQRIEEYGYRIQVEEREAKRKEVEADGIRRFQQVVSGNLTPNYLRWRGIEATLQLAQSPNAKVVVVGSGPGGLPLILNTGETEAASKVAPKPPAK
jgi:regulator of protease activity HflC (stomatin/prohibitin superfamily)